MVIAYHVVFSAYGFWLPNDPRGSWSTFVWRWELVRFGKATTVTGRNSQARGAHDRQLRLAAKKALKFPAVEFNGPQALAVANGFAHAANESRIRLYACAILPGHVHLVIGRHARRAEKNAGHLKTRATQELKKQKLWSQKERPVWGGRGWFVYLETPADVRRAVRYVEQNPVKEGKSLQKWSFVTPFLG
jgi:REP element-mobilizing transposase RayT